MNFLDFCILITLGYNTFIGIRRGAILMISSLVGIFITLILTKFLFPVALPICVDLLPFLKAYPFTYFGVIFSTILFTFNRISYFLHTFFKWTGVGIMNHILGGGIGLARGTLFCIIMTIPLILTKSSLVTHSLVLYDMGPFIQLLVLKLSDFQYFSTLLDLLNLPQTPFDTGATVDA